MSQEGASGCPFSLSFQERDRVVHERSPVFYSTKHPSPSQVPLLSPYCPRWRWGLTADITVSETGVLECGESFFLGGGSAGNSKVRDSDQVSIAVQPWASGITELLSLAFSKWISRITALMLCTWKKEAVSCAWIKLRKNLLVLPWGLCGLACLCVFSMGRVALSQRVLGGPGILRNGRYRIF